MSLGKRLFVGGAADFCMNTSDNPLQEATSSLVAGYSLDYDASDITGNYNGTPSNVNFGVDGYINWGAEFNGSSSYVSIGNPVPNTDTEVSISAWINLSSGVSTNMHITGTGITTASSEAPFRITLQYQSANTFRLFALRQVAGTYYLSPNASLTDVTINANTWYHLTYSYNPTGRKLTTYLNGSVVDTDVAMTTTGASVNDDSMIIGSFRTNTAFFNGSIDQVRIFNKALSQQEVTTLYNESACTHTATTDTVGFPSSASSNLEAYYKLDGSAEDESSNSYDGAESNITYEFGRYGTAAVFNGSSSYISIADGSFRYSSITISAWVNPDSTSSNHIIFSNYDYLSNTSKGISFRITSGKLEFLMYQSDAAGELSQAKSNESISTGQWTHVLATFTGSTPKLYIDGSEATYSTQTTGAVATYHSTCEVRIGVLAFAGGNEQQYFNGKIDQVRIYDKALSSDEVGELYAEKQAYITKDAKNPFADGDEVAFYKFENNADDEHDSYDGTASNVTFTSGSGLFGTYAATFNGSSSYVTLPDSTTTGMGNNNFSFSFWVYFDTLTQYDTPVAFQKNYRYFVDTTTAGVVRFYDGTSLSTSSSTIAAGSWYNIIVTKSSTEGRKIYVNGSVAASDSTTTNAINESSSSGKNLIGAYNSSGTYNYHLDGKIDQVRIFDRALDGDEVFKLYAEVIN